MFSLVSRVSVPLRSYIYFIYALFSTIQFNPGTARTGIAYSSELMCLTITLISSSYPFVKYNPLSIEGGSLFVTTAWHWTSTITKQSIFQHA